MRLLLILGSLIHFTVSSSADPGPATIPPAYVPLAIGESKLPEPLDLNARDEKRNRDLPVKVFLPNVTKPAAVLLFSHGLGGNRNGAGYLARHWSARGYVVVCLQHPGSDDSVWKDAKPGERMAKLKAAASAENLFARIKDVPAVLDQLEIWNKFPGHALHARLDLSKVGMSGHSFGAVTTQAVSGQSSLLPGKSWNDPRIKAAIAFSPSPPRAGDPKSAFGKVSLPWLLMTGTDDGSPIGGIKPADRLKVFPALPAGSKYELVLDKAEHSAFTERALPGEKGKRNPNHHRAILAISTAFWDAYLLEDKAARQWLDGPGPRAILDAADQWRSK